MNSTISKLPGIVEAVGREAEVLMDGGIRSGIDVVKAIALGARGVMIGRPWVYALAAAGEQGVADLLASFQKEIATALVMLGINSIGELCADHLDECR